MVVCTIYFQAPAEPSNGSYETAASLTAATAGTLKVAYSVHDVLYKSMVLRKISQQRRFLMPCIYKPTQCKHTL